jgi:hypothetical protein
VDEFQMDQQRQGLFLMELCQVLHFGFAWFSARILRRPGTSVEATRSSFRDQARCGMTNKMAAKLSATAGPPFDFAQGRPFGDDKQEKQQQQQRQRQQQRQCKSNGNSNGKGSSKGSSNGKGSSKGSSNGNPPFTMKL